MLGLELGQPALRKLVSDLCLLVDLPHAEEFAFSVLLRLVYEQLALPGRARVFVAALTSEGRVPLKLKFGVDGL